jgi:glycosyltransferase involved in cell wall biosynthesis
VAREYLGAYGIYAERGSAESLAAKLMCLLDDIEGSKILGKQLRQRAIEQYNWQRAAHKIVDMYAEVTRTASRYLTPSPQVSSIDRSR